MIHLPSSACTYCFHETGHASGCPGEPKPPDLDAWLCACGALNHWNPTLPLLVRCEACDAATYVGDRP